LVKLKVNIEQGNDIYLVHSSSFLGCFAKAENRAKAIDAILQDAKDYSAWILDKKIDHTFSIMAKEIQKGINDLEILEEIKVEYDLENFSNPSAIFKTDKEDMKEEEFETYISILAQMPQDFLRIVFPLKKEDRTRELIAGKKTIDEELQEIYLVQEYFISRFGIEINQKFLETIKMTEEELDSLPILERIIKVRQGVLAILKNYYDDLKDETFKSALRTDHPEEPWTFKKIIRKFVEHERERLKEIILLTNEIEKQETPIDITETKDKERVELQEKTAI
jgi:hypothetical protein